MKLTKAKLNRLVRKGIEDLGYTFFKDSLTGFQGLYAKYLGNGFYLTLGLTIHRYYDDAFTASLYLSKTASIGAIWPDIPRDSYIRIGRLLTADERRVYYKENSINDIKGGADIWWHSDEEGPNNISDFLHVLKVTVPRLIEQENLIERIENSSAVKELEEQIKKVIEFFKKNEFKAEYKFSPTTEVDKISVNWFKAAEEAVVFFEKKATADLVKFWAINAYIVYNVLHN